MCGDDGIGDFMVLDFEILFEPRKDNVTDNMPLIMLLQKTLSMCTTTPLQITIMKV